ncbi:hypothetical protein GCM10011581_20650 [Saccharopolyspora subtropica]|uniref:Secreted protein n=1 Tax=Saccharopolyspora thermophila TaxID=89367 RepID=A0A917NAF0_9PSEU|nr:hypothetical protein [Saccharopolyspora subtropica]GGI83277.1 hypothetical protein GCM10011581_20650 [Saccharopolyspora subtropica]
MGNRVKKALAASGLGLGIMLATAAPALADPWSTSARECWWGGGRVVALDFNTFVCHGGWNHGQFVTHWR